MCIYVKADVQVFKAYPNDKTPMNTTNITIIRKLFYV